MCVIEVETPAESKGPWDDCMLDSTMSGATRQRPAPITRDLAFAERLALDIYKHIQQDLSLRRR